MFKKDQNEKQLAVSGALNLGLGEYTFFSLGTKHATCPAHSATVVSAR